MSSTTLLLKNLSRNRLRTTLTVLAIALPLFVFTIARSFVDLVNQYLEESDKNLRVAVHQKLSYTTQLPSRIRGDIDGLAPEGYIQAICRTTWFGGRVQGQQVTFPSMAVDHDTFPIVYSEYEMTPEEIERFQEDRSAAVVGKQLANMMNWEVGDRVTLVGSVPPFAEMEFVISSIPKGVSGPWLFFRRDYYAEVFEKLTGETLGVNNFWLKCTSPEARKWALREIDTHFSDSEHQTRTEMESTFVAQFLESGGDWVGLVWTVGQLVVLVAVFVAFNTLSMGFRERTREIALMRALGFSSRKVFSFVLSEGAMLGLVGGLIAVLPIYVLTATFELQLPFRGGRIQISETTMFIALGIALATGVLAALIPAWMAGRLQVAPALRKVV